MTWLLKTFKELAPLEVYKILQLRNEVFVVEQNCVFQDADDKDPACWHLMAFQQHNLVAYTRLVPPGVIYEEMSIGRVVTAPQVRRSGIGKELMQRSIEACYQLFGHDTVKIGAQLYLKNFYESFGFAQAGAVYLEDGIEHIHMRKKAS